MATITPTITAIQTQADRKCHIVQWTPVTAADVCAAIEMPGSADRSIQVAGTFDSATVKLQGSNDSSNFIDLTDPQGNAISKTAAAIEAVSELTRLVKPVISGGGGSQSLTITMLIRRA